MKLQALVDKVNDSPKPLPPQSHDQVVNEMYEQMDVWKQYLQKENEKMEYAASDMKKLLALPFYLAKRTELPEPKYGQKEWDVFTKIFGVPWNQYEHVTFDPEEKITEFNYEKYIPDLFLADK